MRRRHTPPEERAMTGQSRFAVPLRTLDRIEQVAAAALYIALVPRLWPSDFHAAPPATYLLLLSEGIVIVFLLLRRPTEAISIAPADWVVAAGGTLSVLLVGRMGAPLAPEIGAGAIFLGMAFHIGAKLSLRRSFGLVAANRGVRVSGLYAFVRHPMYAGYMLTHVGYLLAGPTMRNFLVYAVAWGFFIARIFAEERVLMRDEEYREFAKRVRFRLVPGVF